MTSSPRSTTGTITDIRSAAVLGGVAVVFAGIGSIRIPGVLMSANLRGSWNVVGACPLAAERDFGNQPEHEEIEGNPHAQKRRAGKDQGRCFVDSEMGQAEEPQAAKEQCYGKGRHRCQ